MSIDWRPAKSLEVLKQVNDMVPGRDKSSDGMLGDQSAQIIDLIAKLVVPALSKGVGA